MATSMSNDPLVINGDVLKQELSELGRGGFEVCGMTAVRPGQVFVVLQRPSK